MDDPLKVLKETSCDCTICKRMCRRPCWGTPEDIKKIIDKGFGSKLMLDHWEGDDDLPFIEILCPSENGSEGGYASYIPLNWCVFFNEDFHCDLHSLGLKPTEGKLSIHSEQFGDVHMDLHYSVAKTWNTEDGKKLVEEWIEKYSSIG